MGERMYKPRARWMGRASSAHKGPAHSRSKSPNNPVPDGLNVNRCVSKQTNSGGRKILSLPEHQGDTGQTTGCGHLTPARCPQREDRDGTSGGPAVKNPPCMAGGAGSIPGQGTNPHLPQSH